MNAKSIMIELAENNFYFLHPCLKGDGTWYKGICPFKPGEAFQMLSPETQECLKDLKSDDLKDVRWPPYR